MKLRGEIKGQTIALDGPVDMPDGQRVEVEIRPVDDVIERAREIRDKLEKQWGGKLNRSLEYVREDRDR
jgi:predicted DNA-binding antitoxin AbrB/MazE fold protein